MTPKPALQMTPMIRIGWCSLILVLLVACQDYREYAAYHRGDLNRPQPSVTQISLVHPVTRAQFDREARAGIDGFLSRTRPTPLEVVEVRFPGMDGKARQTAEAVKAYLAYRRVVATLMPRDEVEQVRVAVRRHQVTLPACPDWNVESGIGTANQTSTNWGCATAMNLGLMVANPGDLVEGRDMGLGDAQAGVLGIQRYRLGETKPLLDSSTGAPASSGGGGEGE